ncbi:MULTISPECIES: V-type ATP synthase subunit E [Tissierellales]|uniref:V-type ATP synthase subunit E n=1 Tax=Acidilutibacter cellobiosedens TaxID=2507161 RepID=A0A410Q8A6_9FIRM|nr:MULTISPECIES: V-type ATP synthase subunit E [Tissierellales]MBE6082382.1 hypothetical protein [Tissierellaceae bacterium]QAT60225.1 hypothetical protein EQM13_00880 [Acidilutibacter cellobiosedens]SCL92714.1 V-type ATP synthase subunit E [Sporanaerobacter sp. PP17-6a]
MITVEEKLDIFYKLILGEERDRSEEILEKIQMKNEELIREKKEEALKKKEEIVSKKRKMGELKKNEIISKTFSQEKNKILKVKKELLEDLMIEIEDKAEKFAASPEYKNYLLDELKKIAGSAKDREIYIYVSKRDKDIYGDIIMDIFRKNNKEVLISPWTENKIGGFLLFNKERTYLLDFTLKTKIEGKKYEIGELLYEKFKEAGDLIE